MILHQPYGIDDPYKQLPTERFPRDPTPGDAVQIGFKAPPETSHAWVVLTADSEQRQVQAQAITEGYWLAQLGHLPSGRYHYRIEVQIKADKEISEDFEFEVGRWVHVTGLNRLDVWSHGVELTLDTTEGTVQHLLSFPLSGVCRSELFIGEAGRTANMTGLPCEVRHGETQIHIASAGISLTIDRTTLKMTATLPGLERTYFRGTLKGHWLKDTAGRVSHLTTSFDIRSDEWLYGLGERFTDANRLGRKWDVRVYEEYKEQAERTYIPVPLLLSNRCYGVWLQADEPSSFDLTGERCEITLDKLPAEQSSLPLYLFVGDKPYDITASFTRLTGDICIPPKWAFGPWMSANTWNSQARAKAAVTRTLAESVPATVLVIEAWSDESTFYVFNDAEYDLKPDGEAHKLNDFRFKGRWPDPKALIDYCHEHAIRVLLWQIPVLKKPDNTNAQHEIDQAYALEKGYVIRNADGSPYRNKGWWFTDALVLDFTNPEAGEWWFNKRHYLFEDLGIDGLKTDGGEHLWGRDLLAFDGRRGQELFNAYPNLYVGAYHDFVQQATEGNGLTFSRAGFTGAQRYPSHWAGDENSTWSAYKNSIRAGLSASVSGISVWGWDIAGFSGEIPTVELYLRSAAMACFCPIMQYHSELHGASENRDRSPWNIAERHDDTRALSLYRDFAQLRMKLLDYFYDEAQALSAEGLPLMRYPALEYPEAHDFLAGDPFAYLFGRDLLVAPVVEKGAATRQVHLPPNTWVDLWSGTRFDGNRIVSVPAPLERIPVFVKAESPRLESLLAMITKTPSEHRE